MQQGGEGWGGGERFGEEGVRRWWEGTGMRFNRCVTIGWKVGSSMEFAGVLGNIGQVLPHRKLAFRDVTIIQYDCGTEI